MFVSQLKGPSHSESDCHLLHGGVGVRFTFSPDLVTLKNTSNPVILTQISIIQVFNFQQQHLKQATATRSVVGFQFPVRNHRSTPGVCEMSPVKSPEKLGAPAAGEGDKIVDEKDEVEGLLPGWTKEVKVRKTGSATKVDRFYTDPVTGYIFRSLRDAQRYLKTGEVGRLAIKPKVKEREEPSELKEALSETMRHKRTSADKPESPARSSKRLAGISIDAVLPPPSSPLSQPKTRQTARLAGVTVDAPPQPKTHQAIRLAEVAVNASPPEPKTRQATRLAVTTIDAPPSPSLPEPKTHETIQRAEGAVDALPPSVPSPAAPKTRQAARQAKIKTDSPPPLPPDVKTSQATLLTRTEMGPSPPSQPEPRTRQAKRVSGIKDTASPASPPQPKTRRATQQAGIKINSPPPSPPDTRTTRQASRTRMVSSATQKENDEKTAAEKITDEHNEQQELQSRLPPVTPIEHNKEIEMRPMKSASPKDQAPSTVLPPVSLEKQKFPVVNPTISSTIPQDSYGYGSDMKSDSSINFSMNDLWTDPCIEFAVKTLTGAIPVTDLNKVENFTPAPLQVPVEELWTDPCIEFAVKTLTGAIPVREDNFLPNRPATGTNPQVPHQFSSPDAGTNFHQTDVFPKPYETGHKNKQHDSVFPTLGNSGLQKSGAFVNGNNGQCSRSRFFQ